MALTKITGGVIDTTTSITAVGATFSGNVSVAGTITYDDVTNIDSVGLITARSGIVINDGGIIVVGVTTVSAGSTSAPSISPTGDTNTGIFFPSADTIAFGEGGAESLRIDSSGNIVISSNSKLSIPSGTASLPSVFFTGDENTGIYSPGADQLAISTGGSGRLFVDDQGRVGVGAAAVAGVNFNVQGSSALFRVTGASATNPTFQLSSAGVTSWSQIVSGSDSSLSFSRDGTERMRLDSSGRLGIGTNSPSTTLSVAGGISGTAGANISGAGWGVLPYVANSLVIDNNAGEARFFATGANATTRGSFIFYNGETDGGAGAAMVIDSSSRVGIGSNAPTKSLEVAAGATSGNGILVTGSSSPQIRIEEAGGVTGSFGLDGAGSYFGTITNHPQIFRTNATERARIDTSGRLLVGTSSARSSFFNQSWTPQIQSENTTDQTTALSLVCSGNNANQGLIILGNNRGSVGSNAVVQNDDGIGLISFQGNDGDGMVEGARIQAAIDGTPGANDLPTRLIFSTTADGASSPTERMRISASGQVRIERSGDHFFLKQASGNFGWVQSADQDNGAFRIFRFETGVNQERMRIASDGSLFLYALSGSASAMANVKYDTSTKEVYYDTSSRLVKENITDLRHGLEAIKAIQPRTYTAIGGNPDQEIIGFIADELVSVVPEAVFTGAKSVITGNDEDTEIIPLGISYDSLIPVLVKALQEATAKIETLEARLSAAGVE